MISMDFNVPGRLYNAPGALYRPVWAEFSGFLRSSWGLKGFETGLYNAAGALYRAPGEPGYTTAQIWRPQASKFRILRAGVPKILISYLICMAQAPV